MRPEGRRKVRHVAPSEATPGPLSLAGFVAVALVVSVLVLLHQEHAYENDPQMRARAGLVTVDSDISLLRSANFERALSDVAGYVHAGGAIAGMSVTPAEVSATVISAAGEITDVTITPGNHVEVTDTGNRRNDRRGVQAADISPAAPERILLGAQRRFGLRPKEFERLELDVPSGDSPGGWSASWTQPVDDDGLVAALDGTHLRRPFG